MYWLCKRWVVTTCCFTASLLSSNWNSRCLDSKKWQKSHIFCTTQCLCMCEYLKVLCQQLWGVFLLLELYLFSCPSHFIDRNHHLSSHLKSHSVLKWPARKQPSASHWNSALVLYALLITPYTFFALINSDCHLLNNGNLKFGLFQCKMYLWNPQHQ